MTKIQANAKTHVGQVRDHNEDTFIVGLNPVLDSWVLSSDDQDISESGAVFVVADGMGGENAGEIAAEIAVQSIKAYIQSELKKEGETNIVRLLESSLIFAHNQIKDACRVNAEYIGMGTTASVCFIKNDKLFVSWIGDSRVYRYSRHGRVHALPYHFNNLEILSEDHSKVWQMMVHGEISLEEARTHEQSNIITQSLGDLFRTPRPESREYPLFQDDFILICSDGLNGMLSDESIEKIISSENDSPEKIAENMVIEANIAGGHDNITLILIKIIEGIPFNESQTLKKKGENTIKTIAVNNPKKRKSVRFLLGFLFALFLVFTFIQREKILSWIKAGIKNNPVIKQDSIPTNTETPEVLKPEVDEVDVETPGSDYYL
ncbi:MAG: serine/threonine-protein phosphatase [Saprospiraceae bacterium]|nr:serine/threonine-protein phosphatase [Saprospiraceae bacterium]